ncbi:MAG: hypothetical protein ABR606_08670 [Vicinamibacterales bacterium]
MRAARVHLLLSMTVFLVPSPTPGEGQAVPLPATLTKAIWAALAPALPYPAATSADLPDTGDADPLWLLRRFDGESGRIAEVLANPLNPENQERAEQAMAAIQEAVTRAERRAQAEYERTIRERAHSRADREIRGISLDDEGVAGERADWEARLTIEAHVGRIPHWTVEGQASPHTRAISAATIVSVGSGEYDEGTGDVRRRRYRPAEARVYFALTPSVTKSGGGEYVVQAAAVDAEHAVAIALRGNASLLEDVLAKSNWTALSAHLRP